MKVLIRTLKGKIFNKITANDSKSYLGYLNKLVVEYKNTDHILLVENLFMLIILLLHLKNLNLDIKLINLKLVIE